MQHASFLNPATCQGRLLLCPAHRNHVDGPALIPICTFRTTGRLDGTTAAQLPGVQLQSRPTLLSVAAIPLRVSWRKDLQWDAHEQQLPRTQREVSPDLRVLYTDL